MNKERKKGIMALCLFGQLTIIIIIIIGPPRYAFDLSRTAYMQLPWNAVFRLKASAADRGLVMCVVCSDLVSVI
jgi:hypothetical protein